MTNLSTSSREQEVAAGILRSKSLGTLVLDPAVSFFSGVTGEDINMAGTGSLAYAKTVGQRALTYLQQVDPNKANAVLDKLSVNSGGSGVDKLLASKNPTVQQGIVFSMVKAGVDAKLFDEPAVLTKEERARYSEVIAKAVAETTVAVDVKQQPASSTGDPFLDGLTRNAEIAKVLAATGWSLSTYGLILRSINSHTSADLERFQLAREINRS